MLRLLMAAGAALSLLAAPVAADDLKSCVESLGPAAIQACGAAISSGKLQGNDLARAYHQRGRAFRQNNPDRAMADYSEAIRLNPKFAQAYVDRGIVAFQSGDSDRTIADETEALRLDPQIKLAQRYRGVAWRNKNENDKALADLNEAIKTDPKDAFAYFGRGLTWANKGELDRAIADYEAAIAINPKYAVAYRFRGIAWRNKGNADNALADFDESVRLNPASSATLVDRAAAWMNKGDFDRAFADSDSAVSLDPKSAAAYRQRGIALRSKGEIDRSLADFDEGVRLAPDGSTYYLSRGITWEKKGNADRALADYDEAIKIDPRNALALNMRALAHERKGNYDKAISDFRAVFAINPKTPNVVERLKRVEEKKAILTASPAAALSESRVALVIGNNSYSHVPRLPNPQADAQMIADTLKGIGFDTVRLEVDMTREKLINALKNFSRDASRADWAVVYYAGHGIEVGGNNYLVPVEAKLESDRDVAFEAIALDQILLSVEGARKMRLVILDACRDNPFAQSMSRSIGTRSVGRGLAQIEPDGATLVAYAAKHGQFALDGQEGQNSPFVSALVKQLNTPGVEISLLFRKVRDDVLRATGRRQEPFVYGSLSSEEFYFRKP